MSHPPTPLYHYRYLGAYPLVFRSPCGSFSTLLHHGEQFQLAQVIVHPLIQLISTERIENE